MKLPCMIVAAAVGCGGARTPPSRAESPAPAHHGPSAAAATCDAVSCVFADYRGACCEALQRAPEELDRARFEAKMSTFADAADRCAAEHHAAGYFVVSIQIAPDGSVASVGKPAAFAGTLDPAVLACITSAVQTARFDATKYGATLSYPFELHAAPR